MWAAIRIQVQRSAASGVRSFGVVHPRVCFAKRNGPNPVGRGKSGSKLHVLSEAQGVPLVVGTSGADTNDSLASCLW